ncbi:hypothetical protein J2W98_003735 [Paenibacillus peoriae]|uniref:Uncharacterized protein n=1 Tax=Paenibacillus peoriae TaxID=59893 RepID=A0ABU1QIM7_9BACL|nr:hypothetical protein [Paenibacillus peoriae]MDR6779455.1 hypothetical protein [Paenibacillus peoriae]
MKKLKEIVFGFENCESLSVDAKYIGNFSVTNVRKSIIRHYGDIRFMDICDTFSIVVNKNANTDYKVSVVEGNSYKQNTFDRLTNGDIVVIDIVYDDDSKDEIYVQWEGKSDYLNEAQKTYISKLGDLFIVISKEETVESFFEDWGIDSQDGYMDLMWRSNHITL